MADGADDKKGGKKRAQRATSNVFAMFEQAQVHEFKEAFTLMDQDRDGILGLEDLKEVYSSLGKNAKDSDLKAMLDEAPGPINFTMLLTMFGDKLNGTDPEDAILNAFKLFDDKAVGHLATKFLKEVLTTQGKPDDRLNDAEFNQMLEGAVVDSKGMLDYAQFTRMVKRGNQED